MVCISQAIIVCFSFRPFLFTLQKKIFSSKNLIQNFKSKTGTLLVFAKHWTAKIKEHKFQLLRVPLIDT